MVITIRFIDWFLLGISVLIWGIDHWFISYGLSHLCPLGSSFIPHAIHCLCSLIILCSIIYMIFHSYNNSFLYFSLTLLYIIFLIFSAYMWNNLLSKKELLLGLLDMLLSVIITISISIYFSRQSFMQALPFFPLFLWRFLLGLLNFLCFYSS